MAFFEDDSSIADRDELALGRVEASPDIQSRVMNLVFRHMALGLGATGLIAMATASSRPMLHLVLNNLMLFIAAELGLVLGLGFLINRMSAAVATAMFYGYAALTGLTLAPIFLVYTGGSIATTFFVTGGTFGGMAAWGYFTKRDLTGLGSFLIMGLFGLVLASLANLFLRSEGLMWMTTYIGILIFTGLTAYDTQRIKNSAATVEGEEDLRKVATIGALALYLDFINLFLKLLRLFGRRR